MLDPSSAPEGQGQSTRVLLLSLQASSHAPACSSFSFSSTNPRPSQPCENVSAGLGWEHSSALCVILQGPAQVSPSLGSLPGPIHRALLSSFHPQATSYDTLSSKLPAGPRLFAVSEGGSGWPGLLAGCRAPGLLLEETGPQEFSLGARAQVGDSSLLCLQLWPF